MTALGCSKCPTCVTLDAWGTVTDQELEFVDAQTRSTCRAPDLRRAVPPGTRWWCTPAVDLTEGPVGQRLCGMCFNAVLDESYLCGACLRRHSGLHPGSTEPLAQDAVGGAA